MKMHCLYLLFLFIQGVDIYASFPILDRIMIGGIEYYIDESPMEGYFSKHPLKRPQIDIIMTNSYRGYFATFEMINNELWVVNIETLKQKTYFDKYLGNIPMDEWESIITDISGGKNRKKVNWYNGLLSLSPIYERNENCRIIEIKNGNIVLECYLDQEQFYKYRNAKYTMEISSIIGGPLYYKGLYNKLNDGTMPEELLNYLIRNTVNNKDSKLYSINFLERVIIICGMLIFVSLMIFIIKRSVKRK